MSFLRRYLPNTLVLLGAAMLSWNITAFEVDVSGDAEGVSGSGEYSEGAREGVLFGALSLTGGLLLRSRR
jgi:hypothetical protein